MVGAHATAIHGVPPGTQYLDARIDPDPENSDGAWPARATFGAPLSTLGGTRDDLRRSGTVIQLGLPYRIDLLTTLSGLDDFDTAWEGRVEHVVRGGHMPCLGRDALLRNNRASGRRKDLADIEALGENPDA